MRKILSILAIALFMLPASLSPAVAQTKDSFTDIRYVTVCNSGCDYTTMQSALNSVAANEKVVITVNNTLKAAKAVGSISVDNINLTIKCSAGSVLNAMGQDHVINIDSDSSLLTIQDCNVNGALYGAFFLKGQSMWLNVMDSNINNNGVGVTQDENSYGNISLSRSTFKNNSYAAVAASGNTQVYMHNNVVSGSRYAAILLGDTVGADFMHNTFDSLWSVLYIAQDAQTNSFLTNNIVSNLSHYMISGDTGTDCNVTSNYNLIHNVHALRNNCAGTDSNIVYGNPQYTDIDYHVALTSPAIDAASTSTLNQDKEKFCRNTPGNQADLGAYEMDSVCR